MANLLDRFKTQVKGSTKKIYDYLPKISQTGDWSRIGGLDVIINSWNNILITPKRTYINDPAYGSDLYKLVFDPADGITADRVRDEIEISLGTYDDRAEIKRIEVFLLTGRKGFSVDIDVLYEGEKGLLTLTFDDNTFNEILEST